VTGAVAALDAWATSWAAAMGRACWQGGLAIGAVWILCRVLPRLSGGFQSWLWRLVYLKLVISLLWGAPLALPLLTASRVETAGTANNRGSRAEHRDWLKTASPRAADTAAGLPGRCGLRIELLLLWLVGSAGWGVLLSQSWRRSRRLRRESIALRDPSLLAELRSLCAEIQLRSMPALLLTPDLSYPALIGGGASAVVLPNLFPRAFAPAQLRLMLAHELAHLKRRDLLWAWLPNMGRVLFFFHPLVWLAEREWRLAQEMACDEGVVLSTGASPAQYAGLLLAIIGQAQRQARPGVMAVGVAGAAFTMRRRLEAIRRLPSTARRANRRTMAPHRAVGWLLGCTSVAGIVPWRLTIRPEASALAPLPQSRGRRAVARPESDPGPGLLKAEMRPGLPITAGAARRADEQRQPAWAGTPRASLARLGPDEPHRKLRERYLPGVGEPEWAGEHPGPVGRPPRARTESGRSFAAVRQTGPASGPRPDGSGRFSPGPARAVEFRASSTVARRPDAASSGMRDEEWRLPSEMAGRWISKQSLEEQPERLVELRMPKSFVEPPSLGWHRSPLAGKTTGLSVGTGRRPDPRELKKMLIAARIGAPVDLRALKEALAIVARDGGVDVRVLKKLMAQMSAENDLPPSIPEGKPILLNPAKALLRKERAGGADLPSVGAATGDPLPRPPK
jgi:beta-lactamase regulating signal transducer with metallopeptidase domain